MARRSVDPVELAAPWVRDGDVARWFSRSTWSLAVLARWRQRMDGRPDVAVWVPSFFCNESLVLLRHAGARLTFYPVDENGRPAMEEFPPVDDGNRPDLFVVVHYFGVPFRCDKAAAFCASQDAWLIEDAAHVLRPIPGIGESGDVVLYSPHKLLAIPDGALLVVRRNGPSRLGADALAMVELDASIAALPGETAWQSWRTAWWAVKRLLQGFGFRGRKKCPPFIHTPGEAPAITASPAISSLGRRLLIGEIPRLPMYAVERQRAANEWAFVIAGLYPDASVRVDPASDCPPYLACAVAANDRAAETLFGRLHDAGVPVSTWPDLAPEVDRDPRHAMAASLCHTRVYLPVHTPSLPLRAASWMNVPASRLDTAHWRLQRIESRSEWERHWAGSAVKSLPQTWEYGDAKAAAEHWRPERYLVVNGGGVPIALFQILLKGWPRVAEVARINRGPLMLSDGSNPQLVLSAIDVLKREARKNRWRMMQIAPQLPPGPEIEHSLVAMGFHSRPQCPADSALLSLAGSENELLMGFSGKWRTGLRKGQKLGIKVDVDDGARRHLELLLDFYGKQQREKQFDGTSNAMLRSLANNQADHFSLNVYVATDGTPASDPLGVLATVHFGEVCEYLIGVTNERGRSQQANSVMLWEALMRAKAAGCVWFDVGGLSAATPKGIADFKKGMNGTPYRLAGEWRCWP